MGLKFPDTPVYQGFHHPCRFEGNIFDLEVDGEIPDAIKGTFYRCGPDPQFPPLLGTDVRFNGDGIVTAFRFENGHVDFSSRYVRTDKFKLERAARRALFGAYRNPFTDDPSVRGKIRGTANTHVMFHAGKLLALKEDSPPVAMDPFTLATCGYDYFDGKLTSETFTAHFKIDPKTGEMFGFGYSAKGVGTPDVAYYVIGADGQIKHEVWFEMPYTCMMHDWVVTEDYVVFPVIPITSSLERARSGQSVFMWDSMKEVWIGVLPRYGEASDLRWFRGPKRFAGHFMNGFNEGKKIYVDGPYAEGNLFPFFPDVHGNPWDPSTALARLSRWTLDLSKPGAAYDESVISNVIGEMPKIDERYAAGPYRHGFLLAQNPECPFVNGKIAYTHVAHVDYSTGVVTKSPCGEDNGWQEPVFIPRSPDAPEGDGYLAIVKSRVREMASELVILDVQNLEDGPVATARLPIRLRDAIHGSWIPDSQVPVAQAVPD
jgi:carotenoid cleavage dioxygenase